MYGDDFFCCACQFLTDNYKEAEEKRDKLLSFGFVVVFVGLPKKNCESQISQRELKIKKKKQRIQKKTSEYICAVCLYMRPNSRVFAALRTKFTCEVFNLFKFMYNFVSNHWSSQRGNKLVTYTRTTQKKCFHEGNFYMPIETINLFQELLHSFVFFCPIANLNLPWVNM